MNLSNKSLIQDGQRGCDSLCKLSADIRDGAREPFKVFWYKMRKIVLKSPGFNLNSIFSFFFLNSMKKTLFYSQYKAVLQIHFCRYYLKEDIRCSLASQLCAVQCATHSNQIIYLWERCNVCKMSANLFVFFFLSTGDNKGKTRKFSEQLEEVCFCPLKPSDL